MFRKSNRKNSLVIAAYQNAIDDLLEELTQVKAECAAALENSSWDSFIARQSYEDAIEDLCDEVREEQRKVISLSAELRQVKAEKEDKEALIRYLYGKMSIMDNELCAAKDELAAASMYVE